MFTVIGFYADTRQPSIGYYRSVSPESAAEAAQDQGVSVVAVFAGEVDPVLTFAQVQDGKAF